MSSNTFTLGTKSVNRLGYGAMQLAGPGVFGPPRDRHVAITVLREALALGVNHIDTSDFYGPHVTNQIIREALYPYSDDLTIVTKIGARRGEDASWLPAFSPAELQKAVHDNLRNLGLDVLDVVNLRVMMGDGHGPAEGSIEASLTVLAEIIRCITGQGTMSSNTFTLGTKSVNRLGYGAMQLAGPGVFGPPRDRHVAITVLREALALGVNHIDTSDFYGPHVTNQIIREALYPYSDDLTIVTKIGARRGEDASWLPAFSPAELQKAVHDNLRNLGLDVLDVVNLRVMMGDGHGPTEGSIEASLTVLAEMQQQGLVKHIGLSNVTPTQVAEARKIAEIVCVQNEYNIAHRADDAMIDALARDGIAYVPFFPLGGFTPLQSSTLSDVAASLNATPMQVALAWLLQRSPNILLIPGTSSVAHLRENMAAEKLHLSEKVLSTLDGISRE